MTAANETTYYLADHLGSTRMEFSGGGWPVWGEDYAPYGQEVTPQSTSNHYKFTGYERDPETAIAAGDEEDYANARYYSSAIQGRFMSPDPDAGSMDITNPQSLNRYTYAMNDPVKFVDPTGLEGWSVDANGCAVYTWADGTESGFSSCYTYDAASAGFGPNGGAGGGGGGGNGGGCCAQYAPGQELDAAYDQYAAEIQRQINDPTDDYFWDPGSTDDGNLFKNWPFNGTLLPFTKKQDQRVAPRTGACIKPWQCPDGQCAAQRLSRPGLDVPVVPKRGKVLVQLAGEGEPKRIKTP